MGSGSSTISDDEIALKLMRLYRQAQQVQDPIIRQPIVEAIDGLIAALKQAPRDQDWMMPDGVELPPERRAPRR
jgi:hypothetical protein